MVIENEINYMGFNYAYRMASDHKDNCILILGGALQNISSWNRFFEIYKNDFDVIVCDLPGMGKSDVLPYTYPMEFLADTIKFLLDRIGIHEVMLLASSYGTPAAYIFSERYPERISKVILAGTMSQIPEELKLPTEKSLDYISKNQLVNASELFVEMFMNLDKINYINNGILARKLLIKTVKKMNDHNRLNYLQNTLRLLNTPKLTYSEPPKKPFLIFTGEYDRYTSPERCWDVALHLPQAVFATVKNADHLPNLEQFDIFWQICSKFFCDGDVSHVPCLSDIKYTTV